MLNCINNLIQTPESNLMQWAKFIIELLTLVAVALYTGFTWKILIQSNKQNALSGALQVLQLFEYIKKDYNEYEDIHPATSKVRHGFNGFEMGFDSRINPLYGLTLRKQPNCLAVLRFITTNFSSLLDRLDSLDNINKKSIAPSVLSFYKERLQPFIDPIVKTYAENEEAIRAVGNEESAIIFKQVKNKVNKLINN